MHENLGKCRVQNLMCHSKSSEHKTRKTQIGHANRSPQTSLRIIVQDWAGSRVLENPSSRTSLLLVSNTVYPRHECCISCPSSVSRVWKYLFRKASNPIQNTIWMTNIWSSDNCSDFRSYSCTGFLRCCALVEFSAIEKSVRISIFSE